MSREEPYYIPMPDGEYTGEKLKYLPPSIGRSR